MPPRTTSSGSSTPPLTGTDFLNEYAQRMKSLFDAAAFPLTAVAGTGNAVTASLDPPLDPGGLVNGMKFTITWAAANTGAVTLAINGGTAVPVVDADNVALGASALAAGRRSLIEFVGTAFRILSSAGGGAAGAGPAYQVFTTSGTWTRPTGYDPDTMVIIELWGGGGAGGRGAAGNINGSMGGGGGGYIQKDFRIADLPSSISVVIGAGGTEPSGNGGNSTFGSLLTAFGGGGGASGASSVTGGNGGGAMGAGVNSNSVGGSVGGGVGGQNVAPFSDATTIFGGGGGKNQAASLQRSNAVYGGGGGGTTHSNIAYNGGLSAFGGRGGNGTGANIAGESGVAPGGGGAGTQGAVAAGNGARGECRVWILG
ncbi:glycine-rich domain-containing protein [Tabrizicola sp. M-4]|uniref:glycine-rich domain-containing protein n=1 Tax=Tabrizicola sp. M-4 TaxID=3055847 RepID=UPI003DA839C9